MKLVILSICCVAVMAIHPRLKSQEAKSNFFQMLFGSSSNPNIRTCNCKCGIPNRRSTRLIGGTDLRPYEFPWIARIIAKGLLPVEATLLNDRYVITAATCLIGFSPYDIKVELAVYDSCLPDVTSTTLSVSSIIFHPEYQVITSQNDIALVRLSSIVPFQRRIAPICLPTPDTSYDHKVATIASWIEGEAGNSSSHYTCQPRKIEVPIIRTVECSRNLIESQGCVGVVGSRNVICKDDAGSGVLYSTSSGYYEMIGILSDRQTCRKSETSFTTSDYELPMYTKVDSFINWILENTKDACYCNKI